MKQKKLKIKKKNILIVLSIIVFIAIISIFIFVKSKEIKITLKQNRKIGIYEKTFNSDYIKVKNGKIIKKEKIDTTKLGKQKVTVKIKDYFKNIQTYKYNVEIIDSKNPVITFNKELTYTQGSEIDLLKDVSANDNSKEDIKIQIEGEYDIDKPGTYELYYIAEDSSKNKTKEKFTLTITEKPNIKTVSNQIDDGTFTTNKGFKGTIKNGITYIDGYMIANKSYSLPKTYNPGLETNVVNKANIMFNAAKNEGLNIFIASGFRSYNTQATLYQNYVNRDGVAAADTYSARPGHSEHQTGLAFDVNEVSNAFDNTAEANWLASNCYKYGFILRYPKGKTNETGYIYESWHFRYVGEELATKLYNGGNWITLESYFGITSNY